MALTVIPAEYFEPLEVVGEYRTAGTVAALVALGVLLLIIYGGK
jgi:hypothetical protein